MSKNETFLQAGVVNLIFLSVCCFFVLWFVRFKVVYYQLVIIILVAYTTLWWYFEDEN